MNSGAPEDLVAVAEVLCPQGNRGEVKAVPMTHDLRRFDRIKRVTIRRGAESRHLTLASWRGWRQFVILGFNELTTIEQAESLRGSLVCVDSSERAPLPRDCYYHDDLIGLLVSTTAGESLGRVVSIMATGANDVLVVRDDAGKERLIPALRSVVVEVDSTGGRILIQPIPGLLELNDAH